MRMVRFGRCVKCAPGCTTGAVLPKESLHSCAISILNRTTQLLSVCYLRCLHINMAPCQAEKKRIVAHRSARLYLRRPRPASAPMMARERKLSKEILRLCRVKIPIIIVNSVAANFERERRTEAFAGSFFRCHSYVSYKSVRFYARP